MPSELLSKCYFETKKIKQKHSYGEWAEKRYLKKDIFDQFNLTFA